MNENFTKNYLSYIKSGDKVLDLGAGVGTYSRMFADKGAIVNAVDIKVPEDLGESIVPKKMKVEDFVDLNEEAQYGLVFMRNILQFLDKRWVFEILFPWLEEHLKKRGVIGIETFYSEPEPPFEHPLRSLYIAPELASYFLSWQELYNEQYEHRGPDMSGNMRKFFLTDMIVRKV